VTSLTVCLLYTVATRSWHQGLVGGLLLQNLALLFILAFFLSPSIVVIPQYIFHRPMRCYSYHCPEMFSQALITAFYGLFVIAPALAIPAAAPISRSPTPAPAPSCYADNYLRAFGAASPSTRQADASRYCSSYLGTSVAPVTQYTTTTTTTIITAPTQTIPASTMVTTTQTT